MKISVYAIAKNEESHVDRWLSTIKNEADEIVVLDTGSTDNTVEKLRDNRVIVKHGNILPWRFDIARNISLSYVSENTNICVCTDLDEVLKSGWRLSLEQNWNHDTTLARYKYNWSHLEDGSPGTSFWYGKIHKRYGYRWIKPVHEILATYEKEVEIWCPDIILDHWPDPSKSRSNYLSLLKVAVDEEPQDDRSAHYLGRELMYHGQFEFAIEELKRHLSLTSSIWSPERCASMRFIGRCYHKLNDFENASNWFIKACVQEPNSREPWVEYGVLMWQASKDRESLSALEHAISITERPQHYISDADSWGGLPYDVASIVSYNLGYKEKSINYANKALQFSPNDERIKNNLSIFSK